MVLSDISIRRPVLATVLNLVILLVGKPGQEFGHLRFQCLRNQLPGSGPHQLRECVSTPSLS
mgnify:CR=1 FL=1